MEPSIKRFCPSCGEFIAVNENTNGELTCPGCQTVYSIHSNILTPVDEGVAKTIMFSRAIAVQQGSLTKVSSGYKQAKRYERFRTEEEIDSESSTSEVLGEGLQLWINTNLGSSLLITVPLMAFFIFFLSMLVWLSKTDFLGISSVMSGWINTNVTGDISDGLDFVVKTLPLVFIPLLDPLRWIYYIVLTLFLGLMAMFFHRTVFSTPTERLSVADAIVRWLTKTPSLLLLGSVVALTNLLFFDGFFYMLQAFEPSSVTFGSPSEPLALMSVLDVNFSYAGVGLAIAAFLAFPVWVLIQLMLFIAIPAAVLLPKENWRSFLHSENLMRGRWLSAMKVFLVWAVLSIVLNFLIVPVGFTMLSDMGLSDDTLVALLKVPGRVITATLLLAWQMIIYYEVQRIWSSVNPLGGEILGK